MAAPLGMGENLRVSVRSMLCSVWFNRSMGVKKVAFLNSYGGSLDARGGVDCLLAKGNPKIAEGLQVLSWALLSSQGLRLRRGGVD